MLKLERDFFLNDAIYCARSLLGKVIYINGKRLIITETESYLNEEDKASHARFGRTKRSSILYEEGGLMYVYMIYGIHFLTNVIVNKRDYPSAILIRAGQTLNNEKITGPGKVSKYLGIDLKDNKSSLLKNTNQYIYEREKDEKFSINEGKRIGIDYAGEWKEALLRFWI